MVINDLHVLLKDGFTEKFAKFYLDAVKQEENSSLYEQDFGLRETKTPGEGAFVSSPG